MPRKKKKWADRQIDKALARYESMSDDEFCSAYKKGLTGSIATSCIGVFVLLGCIIGIIMLI